MSKVRRHMMEAEYPRETALRSVQIIDSLIRYTVIECLPAPGSRVGEGKRRADRHTALLLWRRGARVPDM